MYIYITTNKINNKKYIGLSARNSNDSKNYLGSGVLLQKAIKKYGRHNFEKNIIEDHIDTFNLLCEKERYYIIKYNAVLSPDYYNIEDGGISTSFWNIISDDKKIEIKNKISNSLKNYYKENPKDKEAIKKMINGLNYYNYIRFEKEFEIYNQIYLTNKFDELDKYKRKKSYILWVKDKYDVLEYFYNRLINFLSDNQKKIIYKFDKTGSLICKYESIEEAAIHNNIKNKGNICLVASGKRNYAGNFRWSYTTQPLPLLNNKCGRKTGSKNTYKIVRKHCNITAYEIFILNKDMCLLNKVIGYKQAAEYTNLSYQMICRKCKTGELYNNYYFKKGEKKQIIKYN